MTIGVATMEREGHIMVRLPPGVVTTEQIAITTGPQDRILHGVEIHHHLRIGFQVVPQGPVRGTVDQAPDHAGEGTVNNKLA